MTTNEHPDASARALVDQLMDLWAEPFPDPAKALTAFAAFYTDPVTINGTELRLASLVDRATSMHASLERDSVHVLDVVAATGKVVVVFEMTARHIGTWRSALGDIAATSMNVTVRTIDVLTLADGLIKDVWVLTDEVSLLHQLGVKL
jgi:predicted ester cyclase